MSWGLPAERRAKSVGVLVISTGNRAGAGYLGARARQHPKDLLDRRGKLVLVTQDPEISGPGKYLRTRAFQANGLIVLLYIVIE